MSAQDIFPQLNTPENQNENPAHTMDELWAWIDDRNENLSVSLNAITLEECKPWYYDESEGCIRNEKGSFFKVYGALFKSEDSILSTQPIILQEEIGFLGILCKEINGTWHYLMQAKIEPGNVNVVQISPTLQATKSNFTRAHGGNAPEFLDYFQNMNPEDIIVDQIQSEQSSRFLKKRNRNVICKVRGDVSETKAHRWMTLRQIKEFMRHDNMVNMDTRTVLSCIPYVLMGQDADVPFKNKDYFYKSAWNLNRKTLAKIYNYINDYKMFNLAHTELCDISKLPGWTMNPEGIVCDKKSSFRVMYCDVSIEGREVTNWKQPLFAAEGKAIFGLFCTNNDGVLEFLVKPKVEIGCFDGVEIGPTIQKESTELLNENDIEKLFTKKLTHKENVVADVILSEEGGRFYQEENRNVIIYIEKDEIKDLPKGYIWSDFGTLNMLTQVNNCLNIQLRNLLSLMEV